MYELNREEALQLVKKHVKNKNLIKHMLATEVVMGALAKRLGDYQEKWELAGLLHDVDYDQTGDDPNRHSIVAAQMLEAEGVESDIIYAVKCHNERHGDPRISLMDKALYACDPVTGLIVAAALIHPDRKLKSIDTDFVMNRFKMNSFAKGANREQIAACSELGLELREFVGLSLTAMQGIAEELGL